MRYLAMIPAAALLALAASLIPVTHAAAQDNTGSVPATGTAGQCTGKITTEFLTDTALNETSHTSFVGLEGISFTQKKTGCVTGTFAANAGAVNDGDHLVLQILLDGQPCPPLTGGNYYFANSGSDFTSHSVNFYCPTNVAPGSHTVTVQYASQAGGEVAFYQRSLQVLHN